MTSDPRVGFDTEALLRGRGGDPAAWFGLFGLPGGCFVRTFQSGAERVEVMRGEAVVAALTCIHSEGLFEGWLQDVFPFRHRFRCHRAQDTWEVEDAYRFPPRLGDLDSHLMAEGTHLRLYEKLGAHPCTIDGVQGVAFAVWAPNARRVSVVGTFNRWDGRSHILRSAASGLWELFVPGIRTGEPYRFELVGHHGELLPLKTDPFAFAMQHPPDPAAVVHGLPDFAWSDQDWMNTRARRNHLDAPMTVYEVHLGSWRRGAKGRFLTYEELAEQLIPYVKALGFTHLQLMPITEHPFYGSWGYQPLGHFAPTARYGPPASFAHFVDEAHRAGLGVILDWVPAHFPEDVWGLVCFDGTCLYEHEDPRQGRHQDWNTLIYNFGRPEVLNFLLAAALFWLDRFHLDGLRVDAVASMLYLDYSRKEGEWVPNHLGGRENLEAIHFIRRLNDAVHTSFPGVITIAEESTTWPLVSRPVEMGGLGFDLKWNMGWMHDTLRHMSLPMQHRPGQDGITFSMHYNHSENFALPLSHDEVVHGKGSLLRKMPGSREEQFANLRLLLAWMYAHGGKKHLFMGAELAQEAEWNPEQPLAWENLQQAPNSGIHALVRDLNRLHMELPALHAGDFAPGGFTWIDWGEQRNGVISILRRGRNPGELVVAVFNFTSRAHHQYPVGLPAMGLWRERLHTEDPRYGGKSATPPSAPRPAVLEPCQGQPFRLLMDIPPLSGIFMTPEE